MQSLDDFTLHKIIGCLSDPKDIQSIMLVSHQLHDATKFMLKHGNFELTKDDLRHVVEYYKNDNHHMRGKYFHLPLKMKIYAFNYKYLKDNI